jgi:hypothetical protein
LVDERLVSDVPPVHDPDGIGATVVQVAEDAKAYAAAQVAVVKAEAAARVGPAKTGAIFGAVAAVLAIAAVGALLVGLILSLATLVGPLGATAIVVLVTLAIAGVLGKLAADRLAIAFGANP